MKEHKPFSQSIKTWLKRAAWTFIGLELLVLISLLATDDQQQLSEMKTAINQSLNSPHLTTHIERYESFRVGPHTRTRLVFFAQNNRQISAEFHQWFGFAPQLSCVSTVPDQPCQ
ncbi:hypothetical protein [Marinicella meishanensis]|uniref:hypothetical protein n=1 Tax=Marinicella meishanensis TaxID=2873263 RepID=UPI001CC0AF9B|nr:hypothetical protein [Marinicella sp. NBU2979]